MSRAHPFFVKFRGFKDNFPETTEYIGFKFSQITEIVCPFNIQIVPFRSLIRERKANAKEAKNENKGSPVERFHTHVARIYPNLWEQKKAFT